MRALSAKATAQLVERVLTLSHRLGQCDPRFAQAGDHLLLIATHRHPPEHLLPVAAAIHGAARLKVRPADAARDLRTAARASHVAASISPLRAMCSLILKELAIALDDSPTERLGMIRAYAKLWDLPLDLDSTSPPRLRPVNLTTGSARINEHRAFAPHVAALCGVALKSRLGAANGVALSPADAQACLHGVRMAYGSFGMTISGDLAGPEEQLLDFHQYGEEVWDWLVTLAIAQGKGFDQTDPMLWCARAKQMLALGLTQASSARAKLAFGAATGTSVDGERLLVSKTPASTLNLTVCRSPIVRTSDKLDVDEVKRHLVLEQPLPVLAMPKPADLEARQLEITEEFPWAAAALDEYFGEMIGWAKWGVPRLMAPPTLFVGLPGAGKTRLAMRLAQVLGLPSLVIPAGGADSKALSGTSRGWSSGRPNEVVSFIAREGCASPAVVIDEVDKSRSFWANDSGIQPHLLGLLETQTAARHRDSFLLTECDLSAVIWLATANQVSVLSKPLKSRFRVLFIPQPGREHFGGIAQSVLVEFAAQWQLPVEALPSVDDLHLRVGELESARMVRRATISSLAHAMRAIVKH